MDIPSPVSELKFPVTYQEFAGQRTNADLRGRGTLTVGAGAARFVFEGRRRGLFVSGATVTLEFTADQIWNVHVVGPCVQFATSVGSSGRKQVPFVFFARDSDEALAIAALLPARQEADFVAGREFAERLAREHGAGSPWTSVTNIIIAANVAVFVFMGLQGAGWIDVASLEPYLRFGANRADITTDGQWWRLVACMFLHYGAIHLLLNMWALLQTGQLVERLFGRGLYTLAYFGSGVCGSLATLLWHREKLVLSAGASGAVFGVYGALLGYMLHEKHALPRSIYAPLLKSTLVFAGYNLVFGLAHPGIDNAAHVGGFVGGMLLGWLLAVPVDATERRRLTPRRLVAGTAALAIVLVAGVSAAPHFDYRLEDEIAWQKANKAPAEQEAALLKTQRGLLSAYEKTHERTELLRWVEDKATPFYTHWRDEIAALPLTPGRATARRREIFVRVLTLKAESFQHLAAALQAGEADALEAFAADEARTIAELEKITKARK